ncbi:MAG: hypothetical protein QOJ56_30 [Mycobacterium sp.]|nr:hypothetical protein [Mycobacterium sp.]
MTGPSQHIVIHPSPAKLILTGLDDALTGFVPRVQIRQYLTMQHLWTARHAARLCVEREPQLEPNVADTEHRSLAISAVSFAGAFLEALVNEVIVDVVDPPAGGPSARVAGIPVDAKTTGAFEKLWKKERRIKGGPLGKYQAALDAVSKRQYTETRDPYKSAKLLIDVRNHFIHFKPETLDTAAEHDLEKRLKKAKVVENQQQIGWPWFLNKALGAGIAEWACDSSSRFANAWWGRMGLRGSYDATFNQLGPY